MSDLNLVVRVMPNGEEYDMTLSRFTTGSEITDQLLKAQVAPRVDSDGEPYLYELVTKGDHIRIGSNQSLHDLGISDGEIILFIPDLPAA